MLLAVCPKVLDVPSTPVPAAGLVQGTQEYSLSPVKNDGLA